MIFIIIFSAIYTLILFLIKIAVVYFLIKIFNKEINLSRTLKIVLLYEIIALFIFWIYSSSLEPTLLYRYRENLIILLLVFLFISFILFLIFSFLLKKFTLLNWRRAIIIFIALNLIIPSISFIFQVATRPIFKTAIFEKELREIEIMDYLFGVYGFAQKYTILSITGRMQNSLIGITSYLYNILIAFQIGP